MSRNTCTTCMLPEKACICHLVANTAPVHYFGEIHILQHPQERNHSKNTARLVRLLLPQTKIWQGESTQDFASLRAHIAQAPDNWCCIYPSAQSVVQTANKPKLPDSRLLFIDATWRKARKIWHLNPWLHKLPNYHLAEVPQGQYRIRKNHAEHQLSTLEAIAYSLEQQTEILPLLDLFQRFQQQIETFTPHPD